MFQNWKHNSKLFFAIFALWIVFIQLISDNFLASFKLTCQTSDAESYVESAKLLLKGSYPWFRAVGYPLLLAPFIALFELSNVILIFTVLQSVLWVFSLRIIFQIVKHQTKNVNLSWLAASIYAICLSPIFNTSHLLTETIYIFLLLWVLYFLSKWLEVKHYKFAGFILVLLSVSALIRPLGASFFYFSLVLIPISLYKKQFRILTYALHSFLILGSHIFFMQKHYKTNQICLSKNHALHHYLYMKVIHYPNMNASEYEQTFFKESAKFDSSISNVPNFYAYRDSIYAVKNKNLFANNKYATIKTMYVNFKDEITTGYSNNNCLPNWVYSITKAQHILMILLIPMLFLYYVLLFFKKFYSNQSIFIAINLMIIAFMCLGSSLVFWYGDRLHFPFYSLIIIIAIIFVHLIKTRKFWATSKK